MSFLIRYCDIPDNLASNFLIYWSDIHKTIYPTLCPTDVRRIVLRQFNCERYIRYEGIEEVLYYSRYKVTSRGSLVSNTLYS